MKIHTVLRVELDLLETERFRTMQPYGTDDTEIEVTHLHLRSADTIEASGLQISKVSGMVTSRRRTFVLSLEELPHEIIVDLARFLINGR